MRQCLPLETVRRHLTSTDTLRYRKNFNIDGHRAGAYSTTRQLGNGFKNKDAFPATQMSDVKFFPDTPLHLTPLLQSTENCRAQPAIDRLQGTESRIAFTTKDTSDRETRWYSSTHIFPSAYPRSHRDCTAPPSSKLPRLDYSRASPKDKGKERALREADFAIWDSIAKSNHPTSFYPAGTRDETQSRAEEIASLQQPQLWNVIERIVPCRSNRSDGGITLFLAHANGFHKELYEPTIKRIIEELAVLGPSGLSVEEIWSMDTFNAGQSALLNEDHLGGAVSWLDQSRDIQQFITMHLPPRGSLPGRMLKEQDDASARTTHRLVGIGHSFSASGMIILSSLQPDVFQGAIFIDPVGVPESDFAKLPMPAEIPLARGAIARREIFQDREAARDYMLSKPYFAAWDSRVLDLHLQYGFYPIQSDSKRGAETSPVALCTSRWSEALAYSTTFMGSLAFRQVQRSDFQGWAHLICMQDTNFFYFGEKGPKPLMNSFEKNFCDRASTEMLSGGHLVVQEQPDVLGTRIAEILMHHEGQLKASHL